MTHRPVMYLLLLLFFAACSSNSDTVETLGKPLTIKIDTTLYSPLKQSIRGLGISETGVIWAGAAKGQYMYSNDGGQEWLAANLPDAGDLEFRDVVAFGDKSAILMGVGETPVFYKTTDNGESWSEVYRADKAGAFFDALGFWDGNRGIAFSDPVDGKLLLTNSNNGGNSWEYLTPENIPPTIKGEAGFAASGSSLFLADSGQAWIATGGKVARIFHSTDYGQNWEVTQTPMRQGMASTGIFSITFWGDGQGMIVGGDYADDLNQDANAFYTTDGGKQWLRPETPPSGYRSAVAHISGELLLATGTSGTDYSADGGLNWQPLSDSGYHTIAVAPDKKTAWLAGAFGRIAKVEISD